MSVNSSQHRKPYEATPYAALRSGDAATTPEPKPAATADPIASETASPDYFVQEAEKLEQLRGGLWDAFRAMPAAALPMPLIELTVAYTGALRLELSLLAYTPPRRQSPAGLRALQVKSRSTS